jgi:uncharacterized protein
MSGSTWCSRREACRAIITASVALTWRGRATAAEANDLYRAQTAVTGQGEANRLTGFALCLEDVLIKVSGALKLAGDSRLVPYKSRAGEFVKAHRYHDQMSGTPTRDEQGTRDRPYDLIVDFDDGKIDDLLKELGLKPWLAHRPVLGVFIAMVQGATPYIGTEDAGRSFAPREALLAAAGKRGMRIVLPNEAALAKSGIGAAEMTRLPSPTLVARAAAHGGEVALVGRLVWNDRKLGWAAEWQMTWQGRPHRWRFRSATFDEAFRRAIGGAAQLLSGNGDPA